VAINVAANTGLPGVRGPVHPDGGFAYLPIPEREPIAERPPTYADLAADLDLPFRLPDEVRDRRVHLDPEFAGYPFCERHTYGDEHGVKAGPIADLGPGDSLFFYATLTNYPRGEVDGEGTSAGASASGSGDGVAPPGPGVPAADRPGWMPPDWGAYLIGELRVARVVTGDDYRDLPAADRAAFRNNAHVKRETFDAAVLVEGGPGSGLLDRAVPLSAGAGTDANRIVTDLAGDSGAGPWWRRVLRFDADSTAELRRLAERGPEAV